MSYILRDKIESAPAVEEGRSYCFITFCQLIIENQQFNSSLFV